MTKSYEVRQEYFDKCRSEGQRVMDRFGIEKPRCGFGIGLGWIPPTERAFEKMIAAGWDKELHQVKQKFCGLRIYIGKGATEPTGEKNEHGYDVMRPTAIGLAIQEAEAECVNLCEVCGNEREKKGIRSGWALCNSCEKDDGKAF